jgi:BolA protein
MTMAETIRRKLTDALQPVDLAIEDDTARHAGHMGHPGHAGGETHFNVRIVSNAFAGKSRVERQRLVYAVLKDELATQVHALALVTKAPGED